MQAGRRGPGELGGGGRRDSGRRHGGGGGLGWFGLYSPDLKSTADP